jgi:hypothetical protein
MLIDCADVVLRGKPAMLQACPANSVTLSQLLTVCLAANMWNAVLAKEWHLAKALLRTMSSVAHVGVHRC